MTRALVLTTLFLSCGAPPTPPEVPPDMVVDAGQPLPTDAGVHTGFPCDVREVLQKNCAGCHSEYTYVIHFKSRADFHVELEGERLGNVAVRRMNDAQLPMPPDGPLPAGERALISDWVNAGMPAGECADLTL